MKLYFLIVVVLLLLTSAFTYKERETKFKYFRVEVNFKDGGLVADVNGVVIFREDVIIVRSNNDNPDGLFVIEKEVAPEIAGHEAWLVYNTIDKDNYLIIELGVGEGVKISDLKPNSKDRVFFFAKEREGEFEPLPEKNAWYSFPSGGGDLKKTD